MQVACPSCGHVLTVPPEKAAVPNMKARCRCGNVFAMAAAAAPPAAAAPAAPPRVAPAATDRVAAIRAANAQAAAAFAASASAGTLVPPKLPARPAGVPAGAPLRTAAAVPRPAPPP